MWSILVKRVPVLSKAMTFAFFIFSKTALFFIRIPLFVAMLRTIAITLGTAKPRAQGHEATNTLIPRSNIQHISQVGTRTLKTKTTKIQTKIVNKLNNTTPFTK